MTNRLFRAKLRNGKKQRNVIMIPQMPKHQEGKVSFMDFEVIDYLYCDRPGCYNRANSYYYLPALDLWVCPICHSKWEKWGYDYFKEVIRYYDDE